jgi:hypothetical protein
MKSLVSAIAFDKLVRGFGHITSEEKLISAYNSVRDIPYGGVRTRDPAPDAILKENRGTGRGKHILLKSLFESMGFEAKAFIAKHNLAKYPIHPWPEVLKEFQGKDIPGFHDFLKVKLNDRWVTVDATFDRSLVAVGFPGQMWDGKSDMKLPIEATEIMEVEGDLFEFSKKMRDALPQETKLERQNFLKTLKQWISENRASE